jgi:hypothetical protein
MERYRSFADERMVQRQMHQQQHQNLLQLSTLHQENLARNVSLQMQLHQQRQYEANVPPARPPKKKGRDDEDNEEDADAPVDDKKKKKKKKEKEKSQSGLGGDMKYREDEVEYLMECCENILPMGKVAWDRVTTRNNKRYPSRQRKMVNLRNQFNIYVKQKPPTGDPDIPPFVLQAKRIVDKITEKAGLEVLNDPKKLASCDVPSVNGSTQDAPRIAASLSSDPKKVVASRKKRRSPVDTESFVDVLLATEKAQAKREERMEQRQQEERNETLRLAITAMTTIASAFTGREVPAVLPAAVTAVPAAAAARRKRSIDSNSSLDSDSDDSPQTSCRRFKGRLKKYKKKNAPELGRVTKKDHDDNDSDSSNSELRSRQL